MTTHGHANAPVNGRRPSPNRLYRDRQNGFVLGICAGIAEYFGLQRWLVRVLVFVSLLIFTVPTLILYFGFALFVPAAPEQLYETPEEGKFWQGVRVDPSRKFSELRHRFRELEIRLRKMEAYVTSDGYRVRREIDDL